MYDVCIIGAGIVGCFLAHDLSMRDIRILLLDKESDVANGATMANSAIIHAGNDPKDGTRKAMMNVRGNLMYEGICRELGVAFTRSSAIVAATSPEEELTLIERYERALSRGIPAELLTREEALRREPNLSDYVTKAMELPSTGIICPWEVTIALAEEAVLNGVDLRLEERVIRIDKPAPGDITPVRTSKPPAQVRRVNPLTRRFSQFIRRVIPMRPDMSSTVPVFGRIGFMQWCRRKIRFRLK